MLEIAHSYGAIGYFGSKETAWHHRLGRSHTSIEKQIGRLLGTTPYHRVLRGPFLPKHTLGGKRLALAVLFLEQLLGASRVELLLADAFVIVRVDGLHRVRA